MRLFETFALLLCTTLSVAAFMPNPVVRRHLVGISMSEPSDVSSDYNGEEDYFEVESVAFEPTEAEATVTSLLDLVPSTLGEVSDSKRETINEVILKLESLNPTKEPARSSLINGVWELRYAAGYSSEWALASPTRQLALFLYSGGYSPGLFALSLANKIPAIIVNVQDLEISISREQPRIQASVDVKSIFGDSKLEVKAMLEVESGVRLRETYESTSIMGQSLEIPEMLRYSRSLYVTYVDDDILIVRDGSGVPELLFRKEKDFSRKWGTEPSENEE